MPNRNDEPLRSERGPAVRPRRPPAWRLLHGPIFALLLLISAPAATAQVFQLGGGSSSLFEASGGSMEVHGQDYQGWLGVGSLHGQVTLGASLSWRWRGNLLTLGDNHIPFRLPTDVFDSGQYFLGRGAGIYLTRERLSLIGFAGTTATGFNAPFFRGARAEDGVGALFLDAKLSPKLTLFSRNILSNRQTSISGLEWRPKPWLKTSLAGGVGANQGYMASSLILERPGISVKGAYILAGNRFRRIVVQSPLNSETDRGNILVTLRPKPFLDFSAGRFNLLQPANTTQPGIRATVDQFSAGARAAKFRFFASHFRSQVQGTGTQGTSLSVGRNFAGRLDATAYLLHSRSDKSPSSTSVLAMLREVLTPRLSLLQTVTQSGGYTSAAFGGDFHSNPVSIGVSYQTVYSPFQTGNSFRQVLLLNLRLQPSENFLANLGSYVAPDGSVKYTAYGSTSVHHGQSEPGGSPNFKFPKYMVSGRVADQDGQPVAGAAVRIDGDLVFSNSEGVFSLRKKKARPCHLEVLLDEFLALGSFEVVSFPATVIPSAEERETPILIIVRRLGAGR